jgi:hypothetical protein
MIERYTIKFAPAVSQKELEKALHESGETPVGTTINKFRARIEFVGEFEDVKKVRDFLKQLENHPVS